MGVIFQLSHKEKLRKLFARAFHYPTVKTAVVCPETVEALAPVLHAADTNIIRPVLIGSVKAMKKASTRLGHRLDKYECVDLDEQQAVQHAMQMARSGQVNAVMKGSLSTHSLISIAVQKDRGLYVNKRITHVMLMDIPTYEKPLIITDAAFNVLPSLNDKKHIVQNAIDFAMIIGIKKPKVALLSAVSQVSDSIPSSVDCGELYKMAKSGEITGGIIEGPLAFDLAISKTAAVIKKLSSSIAGDPDIVVVPNIDAGNILFKALEHLASATSFGIGVGGKVPIILTSRSASFESRVGSCILAKFYMNHHV
jgi:phosphate acetyltransferase